MADLKGLRVLVVEDEGAIALLIEDMLLDLGCEIAASAPQLDKACALACTLEIDIAVLDLNLDGHSALPVAHLLKDRRIPFLFSTGYGMSGISPEFKSHPVLAKPFALADLRAKMLLTLQVHAA
ncbi:MAG TPA: response regulator [Steroidobacter sp.]|uniref:response regulator n=1 Tax=Steroidobacter sp. TaxID=1978227 RepID=UPI002ED9168F